MSEVIIKPSSLNGKITVPPSKSDVHRAIICAALAKGISRISPVMSINPKITAAMTMNTMNIETNAIEIPP